MPKLTDEDRKQLESLIESPDMGRDAAPLVRALARIDELERRADVNQHLSDLQASWAREEAAKADNAKLRADVEALAFSLDYAHRRDDECPECRRTRGDEHTHDCRYGSFLARTAVKS